ncbi:glutamate receptor ionotropic, kainate 2-like [Bombyx mandarina]|uniref:Glutamate receptor ionotropic, kainate 2-like n=1 Tax=Bombyx mandarina TaxID=7092 RepID=A0A6J2JZU2_BOMMA|nr:glutamate receptor ionotropic, kainate 2-like [Bombyx mandarina]
MSVLSVLFLLLFSTRLVSTEENLRTIGGIFYQDAEDMKVALKISAENYNFSVSIKEVSQRGEILEIERYVCELAEEGVLGIIDGIGGHASEHIQAITDMLELPHVSIQHIDLFAKNWSIINIFPSPIAYNKVLKSLVETKDWNNFTILYIRGHSLLRATELLRMGNSIDKRSVTIRELNGNDYRDVLIDAKKNGCVNFLVDCPARNLEQLLQHAQQVGLMAEEHSYLFVSPDLFTLDLERYRYSGVNITGFRIIDPAANEDLWKFTIQFNTETVQNLEPVQIKTEVLLIHDAVVVFNESLKKVNVTSTQLSCDNYDSWKYGSTLINFMRTNRVKGLTRSLIFDGFGQRNEVIFDLLELTSSGNQTIGHWIDDKLKIERPFIPDAQIGEESILKNKTLRVLIAPTAPYGYVKNWHTALEGNDRYEGFAVDLIQKLSDALGFNYEFILEENYGRKDPVTHKWGGMIYQLITEKADLAICDLSITAERQSVIDFSQPFMTLGIGILYKRPSKEPPEMFSFMAVFSKEVWYYMMLIQMGLGVIMIFVGRISHKEWQNPVPCIEQPEELSNQFSFANALWLIIGSVMQQGSEIAPIALAPRMITSVWWFFTMVMVASYVGILVAFLTVQKGSMPFQSLESLYEHKSISYGAKENGSTHSFFMDSPKTLHKKMYARMKEQGWLVPQNDIGVAKAETEPYAFFMESTSIEYTTERHCDLMQVGDLLDSKTYGIGMKKKSPYKRYIDDALLILKEKGEIQKLKDIWWKEKRGGGNCGQNSDEEEPQLEMKNMVGAFVVLGVGSVFGLFISILDMLWGVFKRSVKYRTTFKFELIEELKFVIKFSGSVKPVNRVQKQEGSLENLAEVAEGKDEIRSLRSIRSGRSTDTRRTHHSHSSRHSSRSLSVAFAKRREYS